MESGPKEIKREMDVASTRELLNDEPANPWEEKLREKAGPSRCA